jgi:hypothetical protein
MLTFKSFITEEFLIEGNEENDHKGKMYELLLGKHLSHDKEEKKKLPEHFRSEAIGEHGGTAQEVHDRLKKILGHEKYNQIDNHAKTMAGKLKAHAKMNGHTITKVHWASNRDTDKKAGDHEKLTGKKDTNSNADLILTTKHKDGTTKHIGVSAKYGKHKPNYRNAGLDSLEKSAKAKTGEYTNLQKKHEDNLKTIGYKGTIKANHALYKQHKAKLDSELKAHTDAGKSADTFKPKSKEAKMAHAASESHLEARRDMAKSHAKTLHGKELNTPAGNKARDERLKNHIRLQVSPKTHIEHLIAHSQSNDKGHVEHHLTPEHSLADNHLKHYKDLHVKHGGISATIYGTYDNEGHKDHGKVKPIASQTFKGSSGATKGTAGAFKLGSGGDKE